MDNKRAEKNDAQVKPHAQVQDRVRIRQPVLARAHTERVAPWCSDCIGSALPSELKNLHFTDYEV